MEPGHDDDGVLPLPFGNSNTDESWRSSNMLNQEEDDNKDDATDSSATSSINGMLSEPSNGNLPQQMSLNDGGGCGGGGGGGDETPKERPEDFDNKSLCSTTLAAHNSNTNSDNRDSKDLPPPSSSSSSKPGTAVPVPRSRKRYLERKKEAKERSSSLVVVDAAATARAPAANNNCTARDNGLFRGSSNSNPGLYRRKERETKNAFNRTTNLRGSSNQGADDGNDRYEDESHDGFVRHKRKLLNKFAGAATPSFSRRPESIAVEEGRLAVGSSSSPPESNNSTVQEEHPSSSSATTAPSSRHLVEAYVVTEGGNQSTTAAVAAIAHASVVPGGSHRARILLLRRLCLLLALVGVLALLGIVARATLIGPAATQRGEAERVLQIIHTNDFESSLQDVNTFEPKVLHLSALIEGLRSLDFPSIFVSHSDLVNPGPFYTASSEVPSLGTNGLGDVTIANAMGINAHRFGPLDMGADDIDQFAKLLAYAEFPYLSVNVDFSNVQLSPGMPKILVGPDGSLCSDVAGMVAKSCYVATTIGNVGIIGYTPSSLFTIFNDATNRLPGVDFVGGRDAQTNLPLVPREILVKAQIDLLEAKGIDVIILLGGSNFELVVDPEAELEPELEGIDVVIYTQRSLLAHTHTDGPFNSMRGSDKSTTTYPVFRRDKNNNLVLYVSTRGQYRYVGNLIVTFDSNGKITSWDGRSGPLATTEDSVGLLGQEVGVDLEPLSEVQSTFDLLLDTPSIQDAFTVFGNTKYPLQGEREVLHHGRETNLGRIAADSFLSAGKEHALAEGLPPVQLALINSGSIRGSILGPKISRLVVQSTLVFDDKLALTEITLGQLIASLENGVSMRKGAFPQVAGFRFNYNASMPKIVGAAHSMPSLLESLFLIKSNGTEETLVKDYTPLDELNRTFVIATPEYLTTGSDGYVALAQGRSFSTTLYGSQMIFQDYVRRVLNGTVDLEDPPPNPRIVEI